MEAVNHRSWHPSTWWEETVCSNCCAVKLLWVSCEVFVLHGYMRLFLFLSVSVSVFDAAFTRSGSVPNGKKTRLSGQLILRSSQGFVPCGREDCRSGASGQRYAQEFSPLLQWPSTFSSRCLGDCSLVPSKPPEECIQSRAEPPAELQWLCP